ncbi:MAG: hypothetical protein KAS48_08080 [Gammaproteobacteria bacterium]|nr:hypothetical protein [Gammaproteobacteria bacterium]MCK5091142.1 hypothetical protein [Gammaproteobacteria bacterium]
MSQPIHTIKLSKTATRIGLHSRQQGAVLVISLIILLIMTMLGVTAMRSTIMEEKMAGNMRDRSMALQASEAAIRAAETLIEGLATTSAFTDTVESDGLFEGRGDQTNYNSPLPNTDGSVKGYTDAAFWANGYAKTLEAYSSGTVGGVSTQPRYFIEYLGDTESGGSSSLNQGQGAGSLKSSSDISMFRITSRGTGGSDNAHVIIRSHYGKKL